MHEERLYNLITGYRASRAIHVAAKLRIADLLAAKPKTAEELAAETGTHAPSLFRLMRALVSLGVFELRDDGCFASTPMSELLRIDVPHSQRNVALLLAGGEECEVWGDLEHSIRTGETAFIRRRGMGYFDYLATHPEDEAIFNAGMVGRIRGTASVIATAHDYSDARCVMDVGGGHGTILIAVLTAHPHLKGILFDRPDVVASARSAIATAGLSSRCDIVGGDFFVGTLPTGADTLILSDILHDWDDARCHQILGNCRRAVGKDAKLLLVEAVIDERGAPRVALIDLHMMILNGGRQRSEAEYRTLLGKDGFQLDRVVPTSLPRDFVEAHAV